MILDGLKIMILALLAVVLQVSAAPQLTPSGSAPDLLAVLVVMLALRRGMVAAALCGFLGGVLLDAQSTQEMGLSSLMYVLAGVWVASRVEPAEATGPVPSLPAALSPARQFLSVMAGAALVQVGLALMQALLGEGSPVSFALQRVIAPTLVETALAALVLMPLLRRLFPLRIRLDAAAAAA